MKTTLSVDPFDPALCIGTVIEVGPTTATAKLPDETPPEADWRNGYRFHGGRVGDFVIVELDDAAIFGRIIGVRLSDDLALPHEAGEHQPRQSIATIRLLSTIRLQDETIETGISRYPSLGSRVYATDPGLIRWIAELSAEGNQEDSTLLMRLGFMPGAELIAVRTAPERLFGRHCAVIGATGGGKSWTLARLMEETAGFPGAKVILFDATGEFHTLGGLARHVQIGEGEAEPAASKTCVFPYTKLTEADLFALFRPSGPVQGPKLRQAIKSLKLAQIEPSLAANSKLLIRSQRIKAPIDQAFRTHAHVLEGVPPSSTSISWSGRSRKNAYIRPAARRTRPTMRVGGFITRPTKANARRCSAGSRIPAPRRSLPACFGLAKSRRCSTRSATFLKNPSSGFSGSHSNI